MNIIYILIWLLLMVVFGPVVLRIGIISIMLSVVWICAIFALIFERVYTIVDWLVRKW